MKYIFFTITISLALLHSCPALAEIKPDTSLGLNSTVVVPGEVIDSRKTNIIIGGKKSGNLLIHSFDKFNINSKEGVLYSPDSNVRTIITRVTNERSSLNGALGINGNQDLIFISPKGITIGQDFQSAIQGSVTYSTASALRFGKSFISTVSKDIFIDESSSKSLKFTHDFSTQFNSDFRVENTPKQLAQINFVGFFPIPTLSNGFPNGLFSSPNQKLSIFSSNITLDGGIISSLSGDVELISVKDGTVTQFLDREQSIYSNFDLGSIKLKNQSNIINLNNFGNSIAITADTIDLSRGSVISSFSNDPSQNQPSSIILNATNIKFLSEKNPELFGVSGPIRSGILSNAEFGRGADININTDKFELLGSSGVLTRANNNAIGGNIELNILDQLKLVGGESIFGSSGIGATAFREAKGGEIDISAKGITLLDSASIQTSNFDVALPGNISIFAEEINIAGINPFIPIGSQIQTNSFGNQFAGDIDILANSISLSDGAGIGSTTQNGSTGEVNIVAKTINLTGQIPGTLGRTRLYSSVQEQEKFLQDIFNFSPEQRMPDGKASNLNVTANNIFVSDNAEISVRNDGESDAGNLIIKSEIIELSDNGEIIAATNGGNGGNIFISSDYLALDNASINSSAKGIGDGGNIGIDSNLITLNKQSLVQANAQNSTAGNIQITADTLLSGPRSDVTASSNLGADFEGIIETNIQNTQVNKTVKLSSIRKANTEISQICGFDGNRLSAASKGNLEEIFSTPDLISAWNIQQRYDQHKGQYFRDIETREIKPIRPVLALEYLENGEIRSIYNPQESEYVSNLISSLERKCNEIQST